MKQIASLLARGHRPGAVVRLGPLELEALRAQDSPSAPDPDLTDWIASVRAFDPRALSQAFLSRAQRQEPLEFLEQSVAPFLVEVGRLWEDGELEIRHEHFVSVIVETCLVRLRAEEFPRRSEAFLLAALPGEQHTLGLEMVALVCASRDFTTVNLGADTPLDEIVRCAVEGAFPAVAVSISLANGGAATDRRLAELRRRLPGEIGLFAGGAGARPGRRGARGVHYFDRLSDLDRALEETGS